MKRGHLEIICGSMYSGKSEELIRRIKRVNFANKKWQLFKPEKDDRYGSGVTTHDKEYYLDATPVRNSLEILQNVDTDTEVVGIDEIQFFDSEILSVIETLTKNGKRVIGAGLDMYTSGEVFGEMGTLLAKAKYIDKFNAVCVDCGEDASHSFKIDGDNEHSNIDVGSTNKYVALCETCRDIRLK